MCGVGCECECPDVVVVGLVLLGGVEDHVPCCADCVVEVVELHYEFWVVGGW